MAHKSLKQIFFSFIEMLQVNVYKERRALALSLCDTKTAVNKLHRFINAIMFMTVIIIWLLVLGIATTHLILFLSSQLLLVVFVFGNTCKQIFEAIIFLFVMHPFDVGDRCVIDGNQAWFISPCLMLESKNLLVAVILLLLVHQTQWGYLYSISFCSCRLSSQIVTNFSHVSFFDCSLWLRRWIFWPQFF